MVDAVGDQVGISPIVLRSDWPGNWCNSGTGGVAYAGVDPADVYPAIEKAHPADLMHVAEDKGGVPYQQGLLTLNLSSSNDATIVVDSMEVVVHQRSEVVPDWVLGEEPGCGGEEVDSRTYDVRVDAGNPQLRLIEVNGERREAGTTGFTPYKVSADDPTLVKIVATTCSGLQVFGISLKYSVNGRQYETVVGGSDAPLRLNGGPLRDSTSTIAVSQSFDGELVKTTMDHSSFNDMVGSKQC